MQEYRGILEKDKEKEMSKQEFLDTLGKALRRELPVQDVEQNLQYYEQYFSQKMQEGMTEAQIIAELGDPRLIAKTILSVEQQKAEQTSEAETVYTEESDGTFRKEQEKETERMHGNQMRIQSLTGVKGWIVLALIVLVVFVLLKTAFMIVWKLLPVILVVTGAVWLYQKFVRR